MGITRKAWLSFVGGTGFVKPISNETNI